MFIVFVVFFHIANSDRYVAQDLLLNAFLGQHHVSILLKLASMMGRYSRMDPVVENVVLGQSSQIAPPHPPLANRILYIFLVF